MRAGVLRYTVTFQQDTGTDDPTTGQHTENWVTIATRHVEIVRTPREREFYALRQLYPKTESVIRTRYDSTVATVRAGHRVLWAQRSLTFDILGTMDPDGRRREVHMALAVRWPGTVPTT